MNVRDVDAWVVRIPYERHIVWGSREADADHYVLVRVRTDNGREGWAETMSSAWGAQLATSKRIADDLRDLVGPAVAGLDPRRPERIRAGAADLGAHDAATRVLEFALTDLRAQCFDVPAWMYLGGWTNEVPVAGLVTKGTPEELARRADEVVEAHGVAHLKVKIGDDADADVDGIGLIREAHPELVVWVDANGGYTWEEAQWVADRLADLDVRLFEDPAPLAATERTRQQLARCALPVLWDSGVDGVAAAERCIDHGAAALSLGVGGLGYEEAGRIVDAATGRGVPCVVGMRSETTLGSLQSLHFHAARRALQEFPAENTFPLHLATSVVDDPPPIEDGVVELPNEPGYGVSMDRDAITDHRVY